MITSPTWRKGQGRSEPLIHLSSWSSCLKNWQPWVIALEREMTSSIEILVGKEVVRCVTYTMFVMWNRMLNQTLAMARHIDYLHMDIQNLGYFFLSFIWKNTYFDLERVCSCKEATWAPSWKRGMSLLLLLYQKFKVVNLNDEPNQMRMKSDFKMMYWVFAAELYMF